VEENTQEKTQAKVLTVLFVCTGNTCRSSMAEVLACDYLRRRGTEDDGTATIRVISAGTGAIDDEPASAQARAVMSEKGLDLSRHKARFLTVQMLQEADLILTMTERHKKYIEDILPEARGKVHLLKEYAEGEEALRDLEEKAAQLYLEIEKKKRAYFQAHRQEIAALEKRKEELLRQLEEVEDEFKDWEKQIEVIAGPEVTELRKIELEIKNQDILDPFGQPVEVYRACAGELNEYIAKALEKFLGSAENI
jgi:protein-tyrosine phosphatase